MEVPNAHIPDKAFNMPLEGLRHSTRDRICLHMNIPRALGDDWMHLAAEVGYKHIEIENLKHYSSNPTEKIMERLITEKWILGDFLTKLLDMNRYDIFDDCGQYIKRDVENYQPVQEATVSSESTPPLTNGELRSQRPEFFDAIVLHHNDDLPFITDVLINKLECERGFKLCVPARDYCTGVLETPATARLITERCKRAIIVLSKSFINDLRSVRRWQLKLALAMAPDAEKMHKLVPMSIDPAIKLPDDLPDLLRPYTISELSSPWFWRNIENALLAPTYGDGGYIGPERPLGPTSL